VDLASFARTLAVEMPYGRKRALEIATTLALDPKLMLLDEPTQGMGHEDVDRVAELIKRVAAKRTVAMVEHNLSVVEKLCDRITVLQRGADPGRRPLRGGVQGPARARSLRREWKHEHGRHARCHDGAWASRHKGNEMLRITDLHAFYGESHVLHGIDLHVAEGELVTLLGRNGSGRSTTLKS
jgi:ABC-type branched-subunit amino acid transport system ATPase component